MELNKKNEQNKQLGENRMKLQRENMNYKSKETVVLGDLKQKMEQLQLLNNLCESDKIWTEEYIVFIWLHRTYFLRALILYVADWRR